MWLSGLCGCLGNPIDVTVAQIWKANKNDKKAYFSLITAVSCYIISIEKSAYTVHCTPESGQSFKILK